MINEEIQVEKQKANSYPSLPNDIFQCEILDINLGSRPTYKTKNLPDDQKVYEKVFKFQFTVLDHRELRGRNVWNNFVPGYLYISEKNGKNDLYKILEATLGHELTQEEEAKIDGKFINSLIGKQIRIFVETVKKGDKSFDKASKYLPISEQLAPLTAEEREKARVKSEKVTEQTAHDMGANPNSFESDVNVDEIPF